MSQQIDLAGGSRPWNGTSLRMLGNESFAGKAEFSVGDGNLSFWGLSDKSGSAVHVSLLLDQVLPDLGLDVAKHRGIKLEIVEASYMEYALTITKNDEAGAEPRYDFAIAIDVQNVPNQDTVTMEIPWTAFKPECTQKDIADARLKLIARRQVDPACSCTHFDSRRQA